MNQSTDSADTPELPMYIAVFWNGNTSGLFYTQEEVEQYYQQHGHRNVRVYRLVPVVDAKRTPRQHESTCVYYELGSCNCGAI